MKINRAWQILSVAVGLFVLSSVQMASAATIFTDDFNAGASVQWGNDSGAWTDAGGAYRAQSPDNFPNARSLLPFSLTDFSIDVDINQARDGGVWLRSANTAVGSVGATGILFVLAGGAAYWHEVTTSGYGAILGSAGGAFTAGDDVSVHIEVSGNNYAAFLNGNAAPITTLTNATFASGLVGLYDFDSSQTFDNVSIDSLAPIPVPAALPLFLSGLVGLGLIARRRWGSSGATA